MDRDKKWDRIEKAYDALTMGSGRCTKDPVETPQQQYEEGITDEYIEPVNVCDENGTPRTVNDNDAVIFLTTELIDLENSLGLCHAGF